MPGNKGIIEAIDEKRNETQEAKAGIKKRKALIKEIQQITGRKLILYVANYRHPAAAIGTEDVLMLDGMLNSLGNTRNIDLMIHTPGGDGSSAERMVQMIWNKYRGFRVIVANSAKSAGTLIALASDEIIMGYLSELGPIDPQIIHPNQPAPYRSAHTYIDKYEEILDEARGQAQLSQADIILLNQIDLSLWRFCENQVAWAKDFAEKYLSAHMFEGQSLPQVTIAQDDGSQQTLTIAEALSADQLRHDKIISAKEARDTFKLKVNILAKNSRLWRRIWELHCIAELAINDNKFIKLWESESKSLNSSSPS